MQSLTDAILLALNSYKEGLISRTEAIMIIVNAIQHQCDNCTDKQSNRLNDSAWE